MRHFVEDTIAEVEGSTMRMKANWEASWVICTKNQNIYKLYNVTRKTTTQ